jgi:hypothetical protein
VNDALRVERVHVRQLDLIGLAAFSSGRRATSTKLDFHQNVRIRRRVRVIPNRTVRQHLVELLRTGNPSSTSQQAVR